MRKVIVPVVPGPPGSGFGGVSDDPVPVLGMPAPTSLPPVARPSACSCDDTLKFTFVEPFGCTTAVAFPPVNGCAVNVCVFCVNESVGVNVVSNSCPSESTSATLKFPRAKKSLTWKLSVYSSTSPARGAPGFVRSATPFWRATVRAVSVCWAFGSVGALEIDCGPGKFGFALVHVPVAFATFVAIAVPPVPSGITSMPAASSCGT